MEKTSIKTHWKKLHNPDFLGQWSIPPGQDLILTIASVKLETHKFQGGRQEEVVVIHWKEKDDGIKPFILNMTNSTVISKIYNTPYVEDWIGKKVSLYSDDTVTFGKEIVGGIRVREIVPKVELPKLTPKDKRWNDAVKAIALGNTTLEAVRTHYQISDEDAKKMTDAAMA